MSTDNPCNKEFKGLPCADAARHVCVKLATDSCSRDAIAIRACVNGVLSSTENIYETDGLTPLAGYTAANIVQCPQEVRFCTSAGAEGGGGGGGGAGDASAANQVLQIAAASDTLDNVTALVASVGGPTDTAAAGDTSSVSLIALFKRHLQRWTTFFTLLPASLGSKVDAASFAVTASTEDKTVQAAIAASLVSIDAGIPAALGQGTMSQGLKVTLASDQSAIPVSIAWLPTTPVSKSGTVTTGATAQQVSAANASRKGFSFQNNSDTDMWLSELTTAVASQPSIKIAAGAYYEFPYAFPGALSLICATTGKTFTAREW